MWDLPGPGLKPVSPASAGRFLTTAPPGKPQPNFYCMGAGVTFGALRSPSRRARLHLPLFPMGLHWVHGCRRVLEAGAKGRELRTSLRWAEPAEGLGQGRRVSRSLSEALGAFTKCQAGPQRMGPTGELRNVPLWLSRFSIRTSQKAFRRWS